MEYTKKWYTGNTGNHQGLVIDEHTGETIAVTYKKENAPLVSAAPEMYEAITYALDNLTDAINEKLIKCPKNFQIQLNETRKMLQSAKTKAESN